MVLKQTSKRLHPITYTQLSGLETSSRVSSKAMQAPVTCSIGQDSKNWSWIIVVITALLDAWGTHYRQILEYEARTVPGGFLPWYHGTSSSCFYETPKLDVALQTPFRSFKNSSLAGRWLDQHAFWKRKTHTNHWKQRNIHPIVV
jgi:hypothetical protein